MQSFESCSHSVCFIVSYHTIYWYCNSLGPILGSVSRTANLGSSVLEVMHKSTSYPWSAGCSSPKVGVYPSLLFEFHEKFVSILLELTDVFSSSFLLGQLLSIWLWWLLEKEGKELLDRQVMLLISMSVLSHWIISPNFQHVETKFWPHSLLSPYIWHYSLIWVITNLIDWLDV